MSSATTLRWAVLLYVMRQSFYCARNTRPFPSNVRRSERDSRPSTTDESPSSIHVSACDQMVHRRVITIHSLLIGQLGHLRPFSKSHPRNTLTHIFDPQIRLIPFSGSNQTGNWSRRLRANSAYTNVYTILSQCFTIHYELMNCYARGLH